MDQKREWDQLADWYQSKDSRTDWLVGYPVVLELLGNIQGKRVLDYGCGNGSFSRFLVQNYPLAHVIGIDSSEIAVANAKRKTDTGTSIEYQVINDFEDIKCFEFDAACFNFVFCTIPNVHTLHSICAYTYQQLSSGGSVVILDPHPESHGKRFTSFESELPRSYKSGEPIHVKLFTDTIDLEITDYYWTRDDYAGALRSAGFSAIEFREPIVGDIGGYGEALGAEKTQPPFIIIQATK